MEKKSYATANGILSAARECGFDEASFHQLPGTRALKLLDDVLETFTIGGRSNRLQRWVWNHLRDPQTTMQSERNLLLEFGASETPVLLFTEDFGSRKSGPPFWIFEATLGAVSATLNNHHLLEFFVVGRSMGWLAGQNHHDIWFASGAHAVASLDRLSQNIGTPGRPEFNHLRRTMKGEDS